MTDDRKTERQQDRKTERKKERRTERQSDKMFSYNRGKNVFPHFV